MRLDKIILGLICGGILLVACNVFESEPATPYVTFKVAVGGNGYDLALDMLETEDAYILAGALGPQCDIVDAYLTKVDKENGSTITSRTFGNSNQGREENFFSLAHIQGSYKAVGFSLNREVPNSSTALICGRPANDFDGKLFLGTLDGNFNKPESHYLELDSMSWDSGFDIQESPDGEILIAGAWDANIAVVQLEADTVAKVIRSDNFFGDGNKLLFHSSGRLFLTGGFIAPPGFDKINVYWAEVDRQNDRIIKERTFTFEDRGDWTASSVNAIVETPDGHLLMTGTLSKGFFEDKIFILKTDLEGNELLYKTIDLGFNDTANDMIRIDGGYVITGQVNIANSTSNSDALIAKIDEEGNILWKEFHDLRSNNEWTHTIIATSDGGFLIGGQTTNVGDGIRTILLIKTDAEGKVE